MQQADDVSSYAREECARIHGVRSLMIYSSGFEKDDDKNREIRRKQKLTRGTGSR